MSYYSIIAVFLVPIFFYSFGCLNAELIRVRISPSSPAYHISVFCYLPNRDSASSHLEFMGAADQRHGDSEMLLKMPTLDQECPDSRISIDVKTYGFEEPSISVRKCTKKIRKKSSKHRKPIKFHKISF